MIPYPRPLTTDVESHETHPLGTWNSPVLTSLWDLAELSAESLLTDHHARLTEFGLPIPSTLQEAQSTLVLIKQGLEASLLKVDRDGTYIDDLLDNVDITDISTVLSAFLPPIAANLPETSASKPVSLLDHLHGPWLASMSMDALRDYPMTALTKVLTTPRAGELAEQLRLALGWMNGDGIQSPSGLMDFKLLVVAARVQLDPRGDLDGFDLQSSDWIGHTYDYIRHSFQKRLHERGHVQSLQTAVVANLTLLEHFPSDFSIVNVPAGLPYRSSVRWVEFKHGVDLAEAVMQGSSHAMSFQELTRYPMEVGVNASAEQQRVIAVTLVPAVLSWAKAIPSLAATIPAKPSAEDISRLLKLYIDRDDALQAALRDISAPIPRRFEIAKRLLKKLRIHPQTQYVNWPKPAGNKPIDMKDYPAHHGVAALQIIASCRWAPQSGPIALPLIDTPQLPEDALDPPRPYVLDDPSHWHPYPVPNGDREPVHAYSPDFSGPSALDLFTRDYGPWLSKMRAGYHLIIERLLHELPTDDQIALMDGDVRVYALKKVVDPSVGVGYLQLTGPARFGFVIQTRFEGQHRTFEVFPNTLQIIKRMDLPFFQRDYRPLQALLKGRFDFEAYRTGKAPGVGTEDWVDMTLQFGFMQPGVQDPTHRWLESAEVDYTEWTAPYIFPMPDLHGSSVIQIDTGGVRRDQRLQQIAQQASQNLIYGTDKELTHYAKGETVYEKTSAKFNLVAFLKHWVIPFWGSIETLIEGIRTHDPLKVFLGILGLAVDVLSVVVPGVKALAAATRIALLTTRSVLRASLVEIARIGGEYLLSTTRNLVPILSLGSLAEVGVRGILRASRGLASLALIEGADKIALQSLRDSLQSTQRRLRLLFTPREEIVQIWRNEGLESLSGEGFKQVQVNSRSGVLVYSDGVGSRTSTYLADSVTGRPYGPPLSLANDAGDLRLRGPATIRLTDEGGRLGFPDRTPDLTKRWIKTADDLYLDLGPVRYKHIVLADGSQVLRRVNESVFESAEHLESMACRPKRGLVNDPCSLGALRSTDFVEAPVESIAGREPVPWFNNRRIAVDAKKQYIDCGEARSLRGNGKTARVGNTSIFKPEQYHPEVQATVDGGNDLFKQVTIADGIVSGYNDTRTVSAVVAQEKDSGLKVLVARADDNVYYRADYLPGDTTLTMKRMAVSPTAVESPITPDDYLALIHNGAGEAHRVIARLTPLQLADDLELIKADLAGRPDFDIDKYIGGPFDMGTSPEEAALFCKYAQTRWIGRALEDATYRFSVTAETAVLVRNTIADDLNALYRGSVFDADNILLRDTLRNETHVSKNLSYLHVRYKDSSISERVYYSWSGEKSNLRVPLADLEDQLRAGTAAAPSGWKLVPEGLEHENVTYINAQPVTLSPTNSMVFLPDIQYRSLTQVGKDNLRILDSERNLVSKVRADQLDHSQIASVDAFTVRPTCQSCTIGLDGLQKDMAGVDFNLYEGPA